MDAQSQSAELLAGTVSLSFVDLVIGFMEYVATKKGARIFAAVRSRQDLWGNFLYQCRKELSHQFPGLLSSLSRADWDVHYPTYPDMQAVVYSLTSCGSYFDDKFIWLTKYPMSNLPKGLQAFSQLFEAMFKIAIRHDDLLDMN